MKVSILVMLANNQTNKLKVASKNSTCKSDFICHLTKIFSSMSFRGVVLYVLGIDVCMCVDVAAEARASLITLHLYFVF